MKTLLRLVVVSVVVFLAAPASAQTCTTPAGWRAPLKVFCPNAPALATDVNLNFSQVVAWLEDKVGQVGTPIALDAGVVTTAALANGAVTNAKLAANAVGTAQLQDGAVTAAKLRDGGVTLYLTNTFCPNGGSVTTSATCSYNTSPCTCTLGIGALGCGSNACACGTVPTQCTLNNTALGVLLPP